MMSILPQASIAVWMSASGAPSLVRSPPWTAVSPAISDAACPARSASRSLMITLAPCSESSSAVARPMPRAEPVTIATLSSRTPMDGEPSGPPSAGGPPGAASAEERDVDRGLGRADVGGQRGAARPVVGAGAARDRHGHAVRVLGQHPLGGDRALGEVQLEGAQQGAPGEVGADGAAGAAVVARHRGHEADARARLRVLDE